MFRWARERWIDWKTDRIARRPSGRSARAVYGAPDAHSFAWEPVLDALWLGPDDVLLDVGCGGGAFLRHALETGCQAAGVDHSPAMVRLARENNAEAVRTGRVRVVDGKVEALPFDDSEFTALSCIVAFLFFPDPGQALGEMRRVLDPERGRIAIFTPPPELRGTQAVPYPVAERARLYTDDELEQLTLQAGFATARVERRNLAQLLVASRGEP